MTVFLVVCAIFLLIALAFALPPFLRNPRARRAVERNATNVAIYRDQLQDLERDLAAGTLAPEQFEKDRQELSRRMLEDVQPGAEDTQPKTASRAARYAPAIAIAAILPVAAALIYTHVGTPRALDPEAMQAKGRESESQFTREEIEGMVAQLAERMDKNPDDLQGWILLARSYAAMGRFPEAVKAFEHAVKLKGNDAQLLADYADAMAMTNGETLSGEPTRIIDRALATDPDNAKALALAGTAAFERGDHAMAVKHWERLLGNLPPDSESAQSVKATIEEARSRAAANTGKTDSAASAAKPRDRAAQQPVPGSGKIAGVVSLSPALSSKAAPDDAVFVFARAVQGPPMPLAVQRFKASDLPASFSLDDSMAMAPGMQLSKHPNVMVLARVSKTGNAMPQTGDLQGNAGPVKIGSTDLKIVIDHVVP